MKKSKSAPKQNFANSRKALRKQQRQEKKVKRLEHYSKKKNSKTNEEAGAFVKLRVDNKNENPKKQKVKKPPISAQEILNQQRQRDIKETNKLKSQMDENRKELLIKENEDEDKMIKKLEKQLGLNKVKNKKKYFADDGLDYLLEICDRSMKEQIVATEKHLADMENDSDFEHDLAALTGKDLNNKNKDSKKKRSQSESSEEEPMSDDENLSEDEDDDFEDGEDFDEGDDVDEESEVDESDNESATSDEEEDNEPQSKKQKSIDKPKDNVKPKSNKKASKPSQIDNDDGDEASDLSGDEIANPFSDDEVSHLSGDEDLDDDPGQQAAQSNSKPDVWEDIYGRKRDKDGNIIKEEKGVYIPPHLRNKDSSNDEQLIQLNRQIKSVLNKLTDSSLQWSAQSIERSYLSTSRRSAAAVLRDQWLTAMCGTQPTPHTLVAQHAALLALLHANVDSQIGADMLEELAKRFDEVMRKPLPEGDKTLVNIVSCLAYLYVFKLYQARLLYDVLRRLVSSDRCDTHGDSESRVGELEVECAVCVLRVSGAGLRREGATQLADFTRDIRAALGDHAQAAAKGSRIKFLLDVLLAVKNNNLSKIPQYDPSHADELVKSVRVAIRKGNYITPLNIGLEDLLNAEERGKWWIVGSAWEGSRAGGGGGAGSGAGTEPGTAGSAVPAVGHHDAKLLELARKLRMNTDVRRSIFCVIMSAEGYMEAYEKLSQLRLRGAQQREVSAVLLLCALRETSYNPYYSVLASQLSRADRKYQLSIQYTLWDKIKELESLSKQSVSNLAQLIIHLIMDKALPLSVLKIIEFSDLNKTTVRFMRQILLAIIMNEDLQSSLAVFHKISAAPKLHMFRESLKLFIQHFLLRNAGKKTNVLSEKEMAILKERTIEVERLLSMHESKLRL